MDWIAELEAFGRRVRDQRTRLGLSVRALASKAGISAAYVTSIEVGRNPTTGKPPAPSIQVVRRLAAALELARHQGGVLFELRCLLDIFDLMGDGDRSELTDTVSRFAGDARWAEFARAQTILS